MPKHFRVSFTPPGSIKQVVVECRIPVHGDFDAPSIYALCVRAAVSSGVASPEIGVVPHHIEAIPWGFFAEPPKPPDVDDIIHGKAWILDSGPGRCSDPLSVRSKAVLRHDAQQPVDVAAEDTQTIERLQMPTMNDKSSAPSHEEVSALARLYWEEEGRPDGRAEEHWTRAVAQLSAGNASHPEVPNFPRQATNRD